MKEYKIFSEEFMKTLLQILFVLICYLIISITRLGDSILDTTSKLLNRINNAYIRGVIRDNLVMGLSMVFYFFVINIGRFFSKPIYIQIDLKNFLTNEDCTTIYRFDGDMPKKSNSIRLFLDVIRKNTFWNNCALKSIKNKKIQVLIDFGLEDSALILQPEVISKDIEVTEFSFKIQIEDILKNSLQNYVPGKLESTFLIEENRDKNVCGNINYTIKPKLCINDKPINSFYKLFFKFNIKLESGYYTVKYINQNMGD